MKNLDFILGIQVIPSTTYSKLDHKTVIFYQKAQKQHSDCPLRALKNIEIKR